MDSQLERAVETNKKLYGKAPRALQHPEDIVALKDVDAVIVSTPEHSHSLLLKMVADAGKDGYCEKPMGNVLEEVKAARDAVQAKNLIVQVGTQHRSEPYQSRCVILFAAVRWETSVSTRLPGIIMAPVGADVRK